jgi:hypothetical protein
MKKLVKTAKQQFEERLSELTLIKKYALSDTDLYYLCENNSHEMSILREIHDKEFYEQKYAMPYSELISSEYFLHEITMRFIEHHDILVKPLFDWYASADKDNEPFTLDDIWMCNLEEEDLSVVFSDLYEEVPDVRVITAKEQWENDSKDFITQENEGDYPFKVVIDDESLRFYYYEYGYYCDIYPSLESLRKDDIFIKDVTDRLLEFSNYEGVGRLQDWIRVGGDFPLSFGWIFYSEYPRTDVIEYEDKELPQEQAIEKKDFLDRFSSLKSDIIANIVELCENGASINTEALFESYSIAWIDGAVSYFEDVADFSLMKTVEGHWKYGIEYGHDKGKTYDGRLELLTLESLLHILDSLH